MAPLESREVEVMGRGDSHLLPAQESGGTQQTSAPDDPFLHGPQALLVGHLTLGAQLEGLALGLGSSHLRGQ